LQQQKRKDGKQFQEDVQLEQQIESEKQHLVWLYLTLVATEVLITSTIEIVPTTAFPPITAVFPHLIAVIQAHHTAYVMHTAMGTVDLVLHVASDTLDL
jgi:uncharacterized protein (DUF2344 family)